MDHSTTRARAELEALLSSYPAKDYEEQNGELVKRVTQGDIFRALRHLSKASAVQGKLLLHLDDRITDFNGFRGEVIDLKKDIDAYLKGRSKSCPVLPLVREVEIAFNAHVDEAEKEELIATTTAALKEKWTNEGKKEERERFERAIKIIGLAFTGITVATATITWILGLWPR